jgi:hypothetical protein
LESNNKTERVDTSDAKFAFDDNRKYLMSRIHSKGKAKYFVGGPMVP